jgi:hypothetical protein
MRFGLRGGTCTTDRAAPFFLFRRGRRGPASPAPARRPECSPGRKNETEQTFDLKHFFIFFILLFAAQI